MRLDHTAALVMSWAAPLYKDGPSAEFVGQLDLSNGEELLARCHDICPWYGEVIRHRKHFVKCLIEDELTSGTVPSQVVIPAAGSSPLALELLLNQRLRVKRVIEVDIAGMAEKRQLYSEVAPDLADRIACITADITAGEFSIEMLKAEGEYDSDSPTIVLFEGISYYIEEEFLRRAVGLFQSERQQNRVLVEYLLPCSFIKRAMQPIPSKIFRTIGDYAGLSNIRCYSPDEVEQFFDSACSSDVRHYFLTDMERLRKGKTQRFVEESDGWVACSVGTL
jgi:O-methyltransferase involved in polyketide biosynthesis